MKPKSKINVAIDLDGVVLNYVKAFTELGNEIYPDLPIVSSDNKELLTGWDYHHWYPATQKQLDKIHKRMSKDQFWCLLDPLEHTSKLNDLWSCGRFNIYFISNRDINKFPDLLLDTCYSISTAFNKIDYPQVIITKNKETIIKALDIKYFIDDNLSNCLIAKKYNPDCEVFVCDYPYNREEPIDEINKDIFKSLKRVQHLNEFISVIKKENK